MTIDNILEVGAMVDIGNMDNVAHRFWIREFAEEFALYQELLGSFGAAEWCTAKKMA